MLRADAAELRIILEPAERHETAAEVVPVVITMKATDPGLAAEIYAEAYLEALENLPLFAIIGARQALFQARTDLNDIFAPTPPEFARLTRRLAAPYVRQLATIEALLDAEEEIPPAPRTEAELERAAEKLAAAGFGPGWRKPAAAPHATDEAGAAALAGIRESILRPEAIAE